MFLFRFRWFWAVAAVVLAVAGELDGEDGRPKLLFNKTSSSHLIPSSTNTTGKGPSLRPAAGRSTLEGVGFVETVAGSGPLLPQASIPFAGVQHLRWSPIARSATSVAGDGRGATGSVSAAHQPRRRPHRSILTSTDSIEIDLSDENGASPPSSSPGLSLLDANPSAEPTHSPRQATRALGPTPLPFHGAGATYPVHAAVTTSTSRSAMSNTPGFLLPRRRHRRPRPVLNSVGHDVAAMHILFQARGMLRVQCECGALYNILSSTGYQGSHIRHPTVHGSSTSTATATFRARSLKTVDRHGWSGHCDSDPQCLTQSVLPFRGVLVAFYLRPGERPTHSASPTILCQAGSKALDQPTLMQRGPSGSSSAVNLLVAHLVVLTLFFLSVHTRIEVLCNLKGGIPFVLYSGLTV